MRRARMADLCFRRPASWQHKESSLDLLAPIIIKSMYPHLAQCRQSVDWLFYANLRLACLAAVWDEPPLLADRQSARGRSPIGSHCAGAYAAITCQLAASFAIRAASVVLYLHCYPFLGCPSSIVTNGSIEQLSACTHC